MSYRPEIDGLRAISVIGVVLFHFQLGFPGGYVGVDVFFVISGYLITSIIVREMELGKFSMRDFWARRIRRIFPAACALAASVLVAGIWILEPDSVVSLAKSSLAHALVVSNIYFWKDADYFAQAAELKPLLHTWSLSIEEQFYICLPIVLLVLMRWFKRGLVSILVGGLLISLGLSIYGVSRFPEATFYLLPTRAWELLAGSVAAVGFQRLKLSRTLANIISAIGLGLILLPMLFYSHETLFPGLSAVPPVLGTVLFLVANSVSRSFTAGILSFRPLVFVGLISYSLYLWHWPVWSFSRHMLFETGGLQTFLLLVLTVVLSVLSWRYVETPFRHAKRLKKNSSAFVFAISASVVLITVSSGIIGKNGFPKRFDAESLAMMEDVTWTGTEYKEEVGDPIGKVRFGNKAGQDPDFVLWGDSHAMVIGELLDRRSSELGLSGVGFITPACPPVTGLWMPENPARSKREVLALNQQRFDWIIGSKTKNVILAARWNAMCDPLGSEETRFQGGHSTPKVFMVTDSDEAELSREVSTAAMRRQLHDMVSAFDEHGVSVWIMVQVPEIKQLNLSKAFLLKHRFPSLNGSIPGESPSMEQYQRQRQGALSVFAALDVPNVHIIDPLDTFYPDGARFALYDSRAFYRDSNHLSRRGVDEYIKPLMEKTLNGFSETHRKN